MSDDSFGARDELEVSGETYEIHRLDALQEKFDVARLPYSMKVLLENVLRLEDGESVTADDVETIAKWDAKAEPADEIPFQPARVLMQDFTGVPAVVDLAAMRDAMDDLGGDATRINPRVPVDLIIDHSVQVDAFGTDRAFDINADRDYERNEERYGFLRWGQTAFEGFRVVPPATGICHQVNLEYLGQVVFSTDGEDGAKAAYPDTLVGTDSHTTMINGLGVLGWGVGGIEAEAAMLGQPISMLLPQVLGFRLDGELPEGATATDLVLRVTEMLREQRRRQQVRRVLRPRPRRPRARRPGDDRQHVAGVRLDLRDLPARPGDAPLPRVHGPPDRADRARRRLHEGAGPLPRRGLRGADLLRHARARPLRRRALDRRPEAAAGPDLADRVEGRLPRVARASTTRARPRCSATSATRRSRRSFPASDSARRGPQRRGGQAAQGRPGRRRRRRAAPDRRPHRGHARGRHRDRPRPRPRRDRRDHELHQHLEPLGDARRRPAREEGRRGRARREAVGEDLAGARLDRRHRLPEAARASTSTSTSSSSTSSATAAPPASGTPVRCRR